MKSIKKKLLLSTIAISLVNAVFPAIVSAEENIPTEVPGNNSEIYDISDATNALTEEDQSDFLSLSDEEIDSKELEINENYNEGDILSEEDTIFILNLVEQEEQKNEGMISVLSGHSQQNVNKSITKFGTKVTMTGTMYQNIAFMGGTSTFRGNIKLTRNSGSLKKVALHTYHSSYGIVGWNGKYPSVGLVYKGSVNMSKTSSLNLTQMDKTTKYNSIGSSYTTMYTQATVTTSKGDQYTLTTGTWKKIQ